MSTLQIFCSNIKRVSCLLHIRLQTGCHMAWLQGAQFRFYFFGVVFKILDLELSSILRTISRIVIIWWSTPLLLHPPSPRYIPHQKHGHHLQACCGKTEVNRFSLVLRFSSIFNMLVCLMKIQKNHDRKGLSFFPLSITPEFHSLELKKSCPMQSLLQSLSQVKGPQKVFSDHPG